MITFSHPDDMVTVTVQFILLVIRSDAALSRHVETQKKCLEGDERFDCFPIYYAEETDMELGDLSTPEVSAAKFKFIPS